MIYFFRTWQKNQQHFSSKSELCALEKKLFSVIHLDKKKCISHVEMNPQEDFNYEQIKSV